MMKINLLNEELDDIWDEANARFHCRFQLWCLIGIVLIILLGFIYRNIQGRSCTTCLGT